MRTTHLLYLHGFRSSPRSAKALKVGQRVARDHPAVTWWCPALPPSPAQAMDLLRQGTAGWPVDRMAVVGSSLGGFYATRLALDTGCRAVLLNPAHTEMSPRAETLLFNAARAQIVDQVIRPALAAGQIVLCDRYADSTRAYQGYGHGQPLPPLVALGEYATGGLLPDLTF